MQKMLELEQQHSPNTPLLVHTDLKVVNEHLNTIHHSFWEYSFLRPMQPQTLSRQLLQNQITGCTTMVNRALINLAIRRFNSRAGGRALKRQGHAHRGLSCHMAVP